MSTELTGKNQCNGSLFEGNRKEIENVQLDIFDGNLPDGINGIVYFQSQCGNPNSGGLPFPKDGPDWGSPNLNGDGMVFKVDFTQKGQAIATSKLMKNPAFYADLVTSKDGQATKDGGYDHFAFENYGIVRMNLLLGAKNTLNTSLVPVKFENDSSICLLATNDVSRPWKIDPVTLEMVTPIGENKEWVSGFPPLMQTPLPMFETSAHPSFDPETNELYIPNYTKSSETELEKSNMRTMMHMEKDKLKERIRKIKEKHDDHGDNEKAQKEIREMLRKTRHAHRNVPNPNFFLQIIFFIISILKKIIMFFFGYLFTTYDNIFLYSWTGEGKMKQNKLVDTEGHSLILNQCMHQTSLSKNYILLMDSSFKFAFDLLVAEPFPDDDEIGKDLNRWIRDILEKTVMPTTPTWLVKRDDIRKAKHKAKVTAYRLDNEDGGLPSECVHFSTDYDDEDGKITIYTAQNNASCLAEWVRTYDVNFFSEREPNQDFIGDYAVGELEVNSIGKYIIDTELMTISKQIEVQEPGNLPPMEELTDEPIRNIGPNTWGIGLYTFRDMISATIPNRKIKDLYFVNFGANPNLLTEYIVGLYGEQEGRSEEELEKFLAYTKRGIPSSIMSIETEGMNFTGNYEFEPGAAPVSIQFIPKQEPTPGVKESQNGYIFVALKACDGGSWKSQLWLFNAWDISSGPVCKMNSKDLNYCATLHSVWLPEAKPLTSGYKVDIRKDFDYTIKKSFLFFEKGHYRRFFEKYIYKEFE